MIRVEEISKRYGDTVALDRLSFEIGRGEILGLLGPNGAGKSTALRILTGFMPPDSGRVELDGRDLFLDASQLRRRSAYLPENNPLYPELSVRHSLDFHGGLYGLRGRELSAARERVLATCGLEGMTGRRVGELSKGYRQRLGLAQALIHDPDLLFLDEPTSGLDPVNVRELRNLIRGFAGEKTVILCTHVLSEVESTCDRVLILDRGRSVLDGALDALREASGAGSRGVDLSVSFPEGEPAAWPESGPPLQAKKARTSQNPLILGRDEGI